MPIWPLRYLSTICSDVCNLHLISYRNPHFDAIVAAAAVILDYWFAHSQDAAAAPTGAQDGSATRPSMRILDLACGSGEASQAIELWWQNQCSSTPGLDVQPPALGNAAVDAARPHDAWARQLIIEAADPFTGAAYHQWTGRRAHSWSFEDVAAGLLLDNGLAYHLVVSSYALHVMDPASGTLFTCLQQLALCCQYLLILSPHKLPRVCACGLGSAKLVSYHHAVSRQPCTHRILAMQQSSSIIALPCPRRLRRALGGCWCRR